jgi:hypothetical protein
MKQMAPIDYERALLDPAHVFDDPSAVLSAPGPTFEQKQELLKRWELKVREQRVAADEPMAGGGRGRLVNVEQALASVRRALEEPT